MNNKKPSKKILIANRGEIALRIVAAAKELGYATVAIYSDADADAKHVQAADESYPLQGYEARETYLDITKVLKIAQDSQTDLIHPGYGFLSENAVFAEECAKAGIKFIGPSPQAMRDLGSKIASKEIARRAKVPVVPGYEGEIPSDEKLQKIASEIGYPLLIKASAGGGGKGMRVVHKAEELKEATAAAQREALAFFKDEKIFLEKYIEEPRHLEVQILGDEKGNLVHLFERECSIQRRHQKMIEESPSPSITPQFRENICQAALRLAKEVSYYSAGTVEFIVDPEDHFYFLEVNTRLQVEHPVTEAVTGIDLVKAQILIAEGQSLPFKQEEIQQRGHAIECRLYAEDPEKQFLPSEGEIGVLEEPSRPGIRIDSALQAGQKLSSFYDPMLAKLITYGWKRREALQKMDSLLKDYTLLGLRHNLDFLRYIINAEVFEKGRYHTHSAQSLLNEFLKQRSSANLIPPSIFAVAALAKQKVSMGLKSNPEQSIDAQIATKLFGFKNI